MFRFTTTIAAVALITIAAPAAAQRAPAEEATPAGAPGAVMRTPCPLHLTALALTPVQDTALRAIRAAHMAEMRAVGARLGRSPAHTTHGAQRGHAPAPHAKPEAVPGDLRDAMRASMTRATDAVRAVLTDSQRTTFEAAVAAHAAEKAERERAGTPHSCDDCCREHGHAMKREG